VRHRIQRILLKLTADVLRAVEDNEEKIVQKSVELYNQIAGEGLLRELGILVKLIVLTALVVYDSCLRSGIAEDSRWQESCRDLAVSIVLAIYRIAKMEVFEHLEDLPKKMNRNEIPIHM